jgi:filamentous hemagglutinin family protein
MKILKHATLALLVAACFNGAAAAPTLPQVVSGQATFSQQGNVFSITNTPNTIINWQSFSVKPGELTRFIQQSDSSAVLNRILGQDPSQILGALQSNGRVFLINPNGIVFGRDSRVDVNALVASTLNLSNADFLAGRKNLAAGSTAGNVSNQGAITTASGGQVLLIAPNVDNTGIISSPKGEVVLAAGHSVQLVDSANPDLHVVVSAPAERAINLGQIVAQGGTVGIYGALVNQRGSVNANSALVGEHGKIVFRASGDTLLEAGSVTSATGAGSGGEIHVLGQRVGLIGDAQVDASGNAGGGTVLIGGDYQGKNAAIRNAEQVLVDKDVMIEANARQGGDGGKVIAWSDGITRAYGTFNARGGAGGGNGGFVETSGKYLDMQGRVDTRAPLGKTGTLLLDPTNIYIANDQASATTAGMAIPDASADAGGPTFVATGTVSDSLLKVGTLQTALGSSLVTVSTANGAAIGIGNITVVDQVSWTSDTRLTLSADGGIAVNASITGGPGSGLSLRALHGDIVQTAPITVPGLLAYADFGTVALNHASNAVGTLAGYSGPDGAGFSFANSGALNVDIVFGSNGIRSDHGPLTLTAATGNLQVTGPIVTTGAAATLIAGGSSGVSMGGVGSISTAGGALSITATAAEASFTMGPTTQISTAGGPIAITADKMTLGGIAAGGAIDGGSGGVSLTTKTPRANVWLGGDGSDATAATLELSSMELNSIATPMLLVGSPGAGDIVVKSALTNGAESAFEHLSGASTLALVTGTGSISLTAPVVTAGSVTLTAGAANSSIGSNVVTFESTVTAAAGLTVNANRVAGSLAPTAGPGVTLNVGALPPPPPPPLPVSAAICLANPQAPRCGAFLAGAVTACVANPHGDSCSAVLQHALTSCIDTPTGTGCAAVLPSLAECIATPATQGCSVRLPSFPSCLADPLRQGCTVVLPTMSACVANPTAPGCTVVLPSLPSCIQTPAASGCSAVLPSLPSCIVTPAAVGCSVVLPTLSACIAIPTVQACSVVLPALSACIGNPALAGCSVVLPSLPQCITTPSAQGCGAVLPKLSACVATPATPGCSAVLPTLGQCTSSPTLQGCSVVLPTLAQCAAAPAQAGCTAVLPTASFCSTHPNDTTCTAINPPSTPEEGKGITPISEATNTTVNVINTTTSLATSGGAAATKDSKAESKSDSKSVAAIDNSGVKNEARKKTFCN